MPHRRQPLLDSLGRYWTAWRSSCDDSSPGGTQYSSFGGPNVFTNSGLHRLPDWRYGQRVTCLRAEQAPGALTAPFSLTLKSSTAVLRAPSRFSSSVMRAINSYSSAPQERQKKRQRRQASVFRREKSDACFSDTRWRHTGTTGPFKAGDSSSGNTAPL